MRKYRLDVGETNFVPQPSAIIGPPPSHLTHAQSRADLILSHYHSPSATPPRYNFTMTAFVESCVQTTAGTATAVDRKARGNPRAKKLLRTLADKKKILVTTHLHPDPDALASSFALCTLLSSRLKDA